MAVKEVNKSAEIRKVRSSGVRSASEIVSALKAKGINVAPALVYNVLSNDKKKKGSKKRAKRSQPATHSASNGTVLDHAVLFVRSAGGMSKAKELLSKLALLHD
jgi:hypothetical protein